jgi:hypothetical protein
MGRTAQLNGYAGIDWSGASPPGGNPLIVFIDNFDDVGGGQGQDIKCQLVASGTTNPGDVKLAVWVGGANRSVPDGSSVKVAELTLNHHTPSQFEKTSVTGSTFTNPGGEQFVFLTMEIINTSDPADIGFLDAVKINIGDL